MSLYEDMPDVGTPSHKVKLDVSSAPPPPPTTTTTAAVVADELAATSTTAPTAKFAFVPCGRD